MASHETSPERAASDVEVSQGVWIRRRDTPEESAEIKLPKDEFEELNKKLDEKAPFDPADDSLLWPADAQLEIRETICRLELIRILSKRKVNAMEAAIDANQQQKMAAIEASFASVTSLVTLGHYTVTPIEPEKS